MTVVQYSGNTALTIPGQPLLQRSIVYADNRGDFRHRSTLTHQPKRMKTSAILHILFASIQSAQSFYVLMPFDLQFPCHIIPLYS